jgi:rod shape-determining protein MreD
MSIVQRQGTGIIILSFIIAMMLTIMPLPEWAEEIRPQWVVLVLVYWAMALPQRVSVGSGWVMGLLLDVANDAVLGQHALALAMIAFLTSHLHQRLRVFPQSQQAIVVLVFCVIYNLIVLWIKGITGNAPNVWLIVIPSFTTALVWPLVFLILRHARRIYRVT